MSSIIKYIPGNITAVTNKTINLLTVPIFLLFYFSLFTQWATTIGAWCGVLASITVAVLIAFSGPIFGATAAGLDPVSFQWISPSALVVGIVVGRAVSMLTSNLRESKLNQSKVIPLSFRHSTVPKMVAMRLLKSRSTQCQRGTSRTASTS